MVASFVHEALFYRSPDDYLALTVPFIQRARTAREPVLVAVPRPKIDLLAGALGGVADGVRFLDMTRAGRNPGKIIPWVLHAFLEEHAGQPVRIIGEPVWAGRSAEEYPACVQHEALINVAFAGHGVSILCPYDSAALPDRVLADAASTHPVLVDVDTRTDSPHYTRPDDVVAAFNQPLAEPAPAAPSLDFDVPGLPLVREFVALYAGRAGLSRHRVAAAGAGRPAGDLRGPRRGSGGRPVDRPGTPGARQPQRPRPRPGQLRQRPGPDPHRSVRHHGPPLPRSLIRPRRVRTPPVPSCPAAPSPG